jgi:benzoyl-CoA reductase/2-hydroxyglutaryl-CoA dehydratase subunit BcrC/BadD/HgdB
MVGIFSNELKKLKGSLEKQFNVEITDQKIWEAIRLTNETKELQQKLYGLRKLPSPPITGAEVMAVMVAGLSMPKEQYNKDLKVLLDELAGVKDNKEYRARLMIIGSGNDDSSLSDIIEGLGAIMVTDSTCFGARLMAKTITEDGGDPLNAISKYLVMDVPFCPKTIGAHPQRKQFILDLAKDYKVDGIVGQCFVSCDMWGGELYSLKNELKEIGIPFFWVEREYVPDSVGQLKTRVQAFLETIKS